MATQSPAKRLRRRPNFSDADSLALIAAVKRRRDVLLNAETKQADKATAWQAVTRDVNVVARYRRNTWEIRRKFKDLRVIAKRKALQLRKHGPAGLAGEGPIQGVRLTDIDAAVLEMFPLPATDDLPTPRAVNGHLVMGGAVKAAPPVATLPAVGEIFPTISAGGEDTRIIIVPDGSFEAIGEVNPSTALPDAVSRPDSRCSTKSVTVHDEDPLKLGPAFPDVPPHQDLRDAVQGLAAAVRQNTAAMTALVEAQQQTALALNKVVEALCGYKHT